MAIQVSEIGKYLFFGILATIVYFVTRTVTFEIFSSAILSSILASSISILFAFFTNDLFVFTQQTNGRLKRLIKFYMARLFILFLDMLLAGLLVDKYPSILGVFVHNNMEAINLLESFRSQTSIRYCQ